jgi:hypothetical protein
MLPLLCPRCGSEMRLIAFNTTPDAIETILSHPARFWQLQGTVPGVLATEGRQT